MARMAWRQPKPCETCRLTFRDRLEKLRATYGLDPDPGTWALSCFFTAPSARRRGLARKLLEAVLQDLDRRGVRRVEAFPRCGDSLPEEGLWTGPQTLLLSLGFRVEREDQRFPLLVRRRPSR